MENFSIQRMIQEIIQLSKSIEYQGKFFTHPFVYKRFFTRKVKIGNLYIGGNEPIRIQSMTTTSTSDIISTVSQIKELFNEGCEIVRVTTRNPKEAKAVKQIKSQLVQEGYTGPIVADVHFSPEVAMIVADFADKVRINPGNFADAKKFEKKEYNDVEYEQELEKIHSVFKPLVLKLKENGKALRIGANHGSLSDRILNRYGDTPEGMVESVIEYIKIAEYYDFKDIVISMKASNPYVMILAYKMLIERFIKEHMNYPIHLGVTEAGDGKDGRMKSASGIGLLLLEGIGDTIRVSLTENPVAEILAAKEIIEVVETIKQHSLNFYLDLQRYSTQEVFYPYEIKRNTFNLDAIQVGGSYPVKWMTNFHTSFVEDDFLKIFIKNLPDFWLIEENQISLYQETINKYSSLKKIQPVLKISNFDFKTHPFFQIFWIDCDSKNFPDSQVIKNLPFVILNYKLKNINDFINFLESFKDFPNILISVYSDLPWIDILRIYRFMNVQLTKLPPFVLQVFVTQEKQITLTGILAGGCIFSNIGDVIFIQSEDKKNAYELGIDILQNTRLRLSRADFISCPSCGRTLFDLETTTQKIKELTQHLSGVKISIMGCIVNGLGEMADADFGYVGSSPGKVNLYKGRQLLKRNVPEEEAPFELVKIIKEANMWKEKDT